MVGKIWLPASCLHCSVCDWEGSCAWQQVQLPVGTTVLIVFCQCYNLCASPLTLKDLLANALDLMKLEKIEFSGFKGKALSQQVLDMHEEFQEAYKVFAERTYDCLDLTNAVGGTGLWELQHHVLVSKAVMKNWPTRTPTDSFPPLPSFCYDLISHSGENTVTGSTGPADIRELLQAHTWHVLPVQDLRPVQLGCLDFCAFCTRFYSMWCFLGCVNCTNIHIILFPSSQFLDCLMKASSGNLRGCLCSSCCSHDVWCSWHSRILCLNSHSALIKGSFPNL